MRNIATKLPLFVLILSIFLSIEGKAQQFDITGPVGSGTFGSRAIALPNGNIVVTDPNYSIPAGAANVGAVYLYSSTGALISTLTGSTANDQVSSGGVTVLTNGNYVVISQVWDGTVANVGAVTFGNGTTGVSGIVSDSNSLVGSTVGDLVGSNGVTALTNGNYVVRSSFWNGTAVDVGAVTFGDGTTGVSGIVSAANSLVGSTASDGVGQQGVTALTNGNYVVRSSSWDGTAINAGAVTFGDGTTGVSGIVSAANSLVGSTANDFVGRGGVTALTNGNYVVGSSSWDGPVAGVGAVTFGDGTTGISGAVSAANSLVGSTLNDFVGNNGVTALTNGNYVVISANWDGTVANVGAVTFGDGTTGISGVVSAANSLVGSTANDGVGQQGVTALTNGNYVVRSSNWDGTTINAGAVTFGDGTTGVLGVVSAANSLVGSTANDFVGRGGVTALTNGNYVVGSHDWDGTAARVGAITFGNGITGISGVVSSANSLVGSTASDRVGNAGVTALTNGNYLVGSSNWDGPVANVGAVTFGDGTTGISGIVSASNSLVGSTGNDFVGSNGVTALTNGNYVVSSANWDGMASNVGAVTFGDGLTAISGLVSSANSLVGSTASDGVGNGGVTALTNGNYVVRSSNWDGTATNVGAVTFGDGLTGISGVVSAANSLVGSTASDTVGGGGGITALPNGTFAVKSSNWDNGAIVNAGAITFAAGNPSPFAAIANKNRKRLSKLQPLNTNNFAVSMINSVLGTIAGGGNGMNFSYSQLNGQIVVGRPSDNIVTIFSLAPTAASASVQGKVQTSSGRAIPRAIVSMTDSNGQIRTVRTNSFGYFKFEDIEVGQTYIFNANAKGYSFATQVLSISEDVGKFNIIAQ